MLQRLLTLAAVILAIRAPAADKDSSSSFQSGYLRYPAIHGETVVFTAEGDLWKGSIDGGFAQRLTTHPATETHAAISPDGATVAFSAQYEGPTEVYTMPLDGGVPSRRTFEGQAALVAGWTPDGKVLYATEKYSTLPNTQLVSLDLASGEARVLPLAQACEGAFSDDGKDFFFTRLPFQGSSTKRYKGGTAQNLWKFTDGAPEAVPLTHDYAGTSQMPMWWQGRLYYLSDLDGLMNLWSMKPDGSDRQQLTRHQDWDIKSAALSAGRIVYAIAADLRCFDVRTGQDTPLRFILRSDYDQQRDKWIKKPLDYLTSAHLSTNGDRVVLTARGQVFVAPTKQGRLVEVTRNPSVRYRNARFSSKDSLVALSDQSGELEFWRLPANGLGSPEAVTDTGKVFRYDGLSSPNQKWLAYADKDFRLLVWDFTKKQERVVATSNFSAYDDFAWSPDGEWLAYAESADNTYQQIFLYRPEDGTKTALTSERVDSRSPAWSLDGKWIYFLSDRQIRSLVPSPWGPRQPEPFFDQVTKVYQISLRKDARSPFDPDDELLDPEKKKDGAKPDDNPKDKKAEPSDQQTDTAASDNDPAKEMANPEKPPRSTPLPVRIDIDGLAARLHEVPVPAGNYDALSVTAKHLLWVRRETAFEGKRHLQQLSITNDSPKAKTIIEDIKGYELSVDGKKILVHKGDNLYVLNSDTSKLEEEQKAPLKDWMFMINPRDEWRQMFTESWRLMRDYFYDRNMHGVPWRQLLEKYLPLVDRVTDRSELSDLMADMVGELSALHTFVRGGDVRENTDKVEVASLGAELRRHAPSGGWRVIHIYQADPEYPDKLPPLSRPGVGIREGDVLLSVDGISLLSAAHPAALLRHKAGKQVLLEFTREGQEEKRKAIVQPIDPEKDEDLRYTEWEYTRRRQVESASSNKIGYVHLRAMGRDNIAEWARDYYPIFQRQGLIIDVRHNRGGNIDSWILEKLLRKAWFYWQGRAGQQFWNMQYAFRGHVAVLCNEFTASDGEAFSEGVKRLGIGKLIGTRTWGGEIWLTGSNVLVDRGIASAAEFGVYGPEGNWLIEGHGVEPDIVVDNLPHATFEGKDAQLEAAIQYLQEAIAKDPRPIPAVPAYPNKARDFTREAKPSPVGK